jgi:3alpha(or 20beta)-hydroxysteroid dehydrogenase
MGRLEGKVALVTGAARGTGAEIARLFVAEGARVVLVDILDDRGDAVATELGAAARYRHLDVTREADWHESVEEVRQRERRLDILVNNAAVLLLAAIDATSAEDFERVMRVNCLGPFLGTRACLPLMRTSGGGSIVNIGSIDGVQGTPTTVAYTASKFALRGITKVTALENAKYGIRANCLCPAAGSQEMILSAFGPGGPGPVVMAVPPMPLGRRGLPADVAPAALYLASDESSFCTGTELVIDGGWSAGHYADVPGKFDTRRSD